MAFGFAVLMNLSSASNRRNFITTLGALAATPLFARDFSAGAAPVRYPEADVLVLDDRFKKIKIGNASIERLHTGMRWAEGPAWSGAGQYLMWSDIPNDTQLRLLADDGHVSTIHKPAGYSNGNTFDREWRQISCEHSTRRVVRYEPNGSVTVLAETFEGKPFNAPNDVVVTPDGAIWFTDPGYGALFEYEGKKQPLEQKEAVYRIDPATAKIVRVTDEIFKPNGLCFSPDYKKLYVADTGASHYPDAPKNIKVWDVDGATLKNGREFASMQMSHNFAKHLASAAGDKLEVDPANVKNGNVAGMADGIRCDTEGNVWVGAGWVGAGYDGVHVFAPDGKRIGQILLPEICSNVCFGGTKRNRLFMTASQSLYSVYVEAQGAHWC